MDKIKISKIFQLLVSIMLLVFSQCLFASKSIIFVSGTENTFGTSQGIEPCILWRLDDKSQGLDKIAEIDTPFGLRRISTFPQEHLLIVWAYRAPVVIRDKGGEVLYQGGYNVGSFKNGQGFAIVIEINEPMRIHQIELPFEPIKLLSDNILLNIHWAFVATCENN